MTYSVVVVVTVDLVKTLNDNMSTLSSVIKLLHDLYSDESTANLLYTNDADIVINVIIRQLTNLSAGDEVWLFLFSLPLFPCQINFLEACANNATKLK